MTYTRIKTPSRFKGRGVLKKYGLLITGVETEATE